MSDWVSVVLKNNQFTAVHIPGSGQLSRGNFYWLQPQTLLLAGGSQVTLSYGDFLQVKERILQDPAQENVAQALYDYDAVGDITLIDTEHGQYRFGYDWLYRLIDVNYPSTIAANDETSTSNSLPRLRGRAGEGVSAKGTAISGEQFSYDGVGNRTAHTKTPEEGEAEEIASAYNNPNPNQLVSQTKNGVETTFTYNANGHTATKTTGGDTAEYIYNHEERLIAVRKNGATVGEYVYNPFGHCIKKTVNGQTTWYLYNDEGLAAEYDGLGNLITEYHFTPYSTWMTEPLFQRRNGQVYYYQNDHLGTPQRMVNASGDVVWEARYQAFGEAEIVTEVVTNNLRFPGQYFDGETGLHHNYFRDYDPGVGRYVQGDPIGLDGGGNFYVYGNNNPFLYIDPLGLFCLSPTAISVISGAVGGAVNGFGTCGPWCALGGAALGGGAAYAADQLGGDPYSNAATGAVAGGLQGGVSGAVGGFIGGAAGANGGTNFGSGLLGGAIGGAIQEPKGLSNASKNASLHKNIGKGGFWGALGGIAQDLMNAALNSTFACESC